MHPQSLRFLFRWFLLTIIAAAMWVVCLPVHAEEAAPEKITGPAPTQWRLVWRDDPAHRAILSWTTGEEGKSHRVHLRKESDAEATIVDCQRSGKHTSTVDKKPLYYHHTRLTGLEPATRYNVVMESDGHKSPEFYFYTAPAEDVPMSILFGGDSRSGWEERKQMNRFMARIVEEQSKAGRPPVLARSEEHTMVGN